MTLLGDIEKVSFWTGTNYQKKFTTGVFTATLNTGNSWTYTEVITHSLGYRPNAKVWIEQDNNGRILLPNPINSSKETVVTTKSYTDRVEIQLTSPTLANDVTVEVYYEVYLDADDNGDTGIAYFSKYPIDRVYQVLEGSFAINSGVTTTQNVTHTQGRPMIFKAIWSLDNTTWYSTRDYYDPSNVALNATGEFYCDSTKVQVYASNQLGANKTFYYKIALIEPEQDFAGSTNSGIVFDSRKDSFKNLESTEVNITCSGSLASGAIGIFTGTLSNSLGLNVSDFYVKASSDTFYYNGYVGAGTGFFSVAVTGGAFLTDLSVEVFLETKNNETKAILWIYNADPNTVTITSKTFNARFIVYTSPFS
jgi:hypothetical protein